MNQPEPIHIIGIGDDGLEGLTKASRDVIEQAQLLVGSGRTLAAVPHCEADRCEVTGDLEKVVSAINDHPGERIVVLTTGDPLFYGVARFLCERLGKERFHVVPHVSTMQMAFARVKESWDEAFLANLENFDPRRLADKVRSAEKVGLFTTEAISPAEVASLLLDKKIDYFTAFVCENLGSPDERVTQGTLEEICKHEFSPLNIMILVRNPNVPDRPTDNSGLLFGNRDETFSQSRPKRGLLTPMEVRAIALALLELSADSIVWDVGAGSGSVSIEAARIARNGEVYAIEMDAEDHQMLIENAERCGAHNVTAILGRAPEAWESLPQPNAIFVGGTGRSVSQIASQAWEHLGPGGSLVVNVGSLQNLDAVPNALREKGADVEVRMISLAHATNQLESIRFEASNPTFLISCRK
ncbi:MAG: precorrin-6y C5,15-methyltransferase (decarboxylating) subunit CbiE [Planctomycetales bacterium]|nr:precorrin-6y C5,15-methyltransferase (decarboxylating) subunit CbiE [Planctomycetales bacterium]